MSLGRRHSQRLVRPRCASGAGGASASQRHRAGSGAGRPVAARQIPLFVDGLRRRLHRQLAVGVGHARRLCDGVAETDRPPRLAAERGRRNRLAAHLQQLPDAQAWRDVGRHLGRARHRPAQHAAELARHAAGAVCCAHRSEDARARHGLVRPLHRARRRIRYSSRQPGEACRLDRVAAARVCGGVQHQKPADPRRQPGDAARRHRPGFAAEHRRADAAGGVAAAELPSRCHRKSPSGLCLERRGALGRRRRRRRPRLRHRVAGLAALSAHRQGDRRRFYRLSRRRRHRRRHCRRRHHYADVAFQARLSTTSRTKSCC